MTWMVEIRGHVSAAESRRDKVAAMGLAHRRALKTAAKLVELGVRWEQLRVVACADNERATPQAHTTQAHQDNQRVEVVVTQEQMPADPYASPAP
jgi:flagellar motor protein MotB